MKSVDKKKDFRFVIMSYINPLTRERMKDFKRWLTAAAVLLLMGAGCGTAVQEQTSTKYGLPAPSPSRAAAPKTETDAAVDAYLQGATDEQAAVKEESTEANALNSTDAQLNAFGQAYDQSEL